MDSCDSTVPTAGQFFFIFFKRKKEKYTQIDFGSQMNKLLVIEIARPFRGNNLIGEHLRIINQNNKSESDDSQTFLHHFISFWKNSKYVRMIFFCIFIFLIGLVVTGRDLRSIFNVIHGFTK